MKKTKFKVGDLVMFANRCQTSPCGMRVDEVNTNMFNTLLKVDGKWWVPECFITYDAWVNRAR